MKIIKQYYKILKLINFYNNQTKKVKQKINWKSVI